MTGLELLRSLDPENSAPIATLLGFSLVTIEPGNVAFEIIPDDRHANPMGTMHGGVLATLLDSAMGASVHSKLPAGSAYTTLEMSVRLIRAVTPKVGRLRAEGRVVSFGSRVATASAEVTDKAGTIYATGTSTCLITSSK